MNEKKESPINSGRLEKNKIKIIIGVCVLCLLVIPLLLMMHHRKTATPSLEKQSKIQFIPMNDVSKFSESESQTVLGSLSNQQTAAQKDLTQLQDKDRATQSQLEQMRAQIDELNSKLVQKQKTDVAQTVAVPQLPIAMSDFSFQHGNSSSASSDPCPIATCVLPGSFVRAVLIGAADADASVDGQSSTTPILFQILENGTMPNGYHSHLKGCFVVGTVYGDISSERGEVKLQTVSCIKDGVSIVRNLNGNGLVYDDSGRGGIRGVPFMNNSKLLFDAGLSGLASGFGSALSQAYTTQSVSPLGSTSTVDTGNLAQYGAAQGASSALGMLAQYYIKRANQYHPVIQLNPGAIVDLMFLQQFNIAPDAPKVEAAQTNALSSLQTQNSHGLSSSMNNVDLGSGVSPAQAQLIKSQIQQAMTNSGNHS